MVDETIVSLAERRIRINGIRSLCHLNALVWLAPAIIYMVFPFDFPILVNWSLISPIIAAIIIVPYASARLGRVLQVRYRYVNESSTFLRIVFCASTLSPALLFADLFILRGLLPLGDIEANRTMYMETAPSVVGYVSLFCLSASLYLLTKTGHNFNRWYLLPWILNIVLFLLSGNRQYALLGVILLFYSRFIVRRKKITVFSVMYFFAAILMFAATALALQFARQLSTEGRQTEFLYTISGIECHAWFCGNTLEPPLLYIYGYFGNIYSGLTIAFSNLASAPIFSLTLPVIYRRLSSWFDTPRQDLVMESISDSIRAQHDIFPNFWSTMFSATYYEIGSPGIALVLLTIFVCLTYIFAMWIRFGDSRFQSFACIGMSFISVGLMYFPLSEPVNFVLFTLICLSLVVSSKRRYVMAKW